MKFLTRQVARLTLLSLALLAAQSHALPVIYDAFGRGEIYLKEADLGLTISVLELAPPPFDPIFVFADGFGDHSATAEGEITIPGTDPGPLADGSFAGEQDASAFGGVGSMGSLAFSETMTTMTVVIDAADPVDPLAPEELSAEFRYVTTLDILATDPLGLGEDVFAGVQSGLSLTGGTLEIEGAGPMVDEDASSTFPSLLDSGLGLDPDSPTTFFVAGLNSDDDGPDAVSVVYIDFTITVLQGTTGGFVTGVDVIGFAEAVPAPSAIALIGLGLIMLQRRRRKPV